MFNISFAELIVILLLGALILGPGEIGAIARFCGKAVRKSRGLLTQIKEYVNADEEMESEMREIESAVAEIKEVKDSLHPETCLKPHNSDTTHKES